MRELVTLGQLADAKVISMGDGYRTKRSEHGEPGFRILRVADVQDGAVRLQSTDFVSSDFESQIGAKLSQSGDVLLTTKGTVGRVAIYPEGAETSVYSPQLCYFRINDDALLSRRYLASWFRSASFLQQASHRANNTDMAAYINLADIRSLALPLPPFSEQAAIAEVLGALDDKIAANAKARRLAAELAAARHHELARAVEETASVEDLMTFEYGKALPSPARRPGPVVVYGSGGIAGAHDEALVDRAGVVVGRKGTAGAVYWADGPHYPIDTTFYVVPKSPSTPLSYCYWALKTAGLSDMNSDSAVPGLSRSEAYACKIKRPTNKQLRAFDSAVQPHFDHAAALTREDRILMGTRDTLLPLLMSGRVRVKDAERVAADCISTSTQLGQEL